MLTRITRSLVANKAVQKVAIRSMGGATPAHWKSPVELARYHQAHMDNQPVPQGSWQEDFNKRNSRYNMQLAASTVFLFVTLGAMYQAGCLYLHDFKRSEWKKINVDATQKLEDDLDD